MIELEMYGIMPSANTVARVRLPPEKRSNRPKSVPFCASKKEVSAEALTPGTGICRPIRYTRISATVIKTFRRSSGILKTFLKLVKNLFITSNNLFRLGLAAGALYLGPRLGRKVMGPYGESGVQLAAAQDPQVANPLLLHGFTFF